MATATLTFDLNDPDDRMEHYRCVKSLDMALVIWDIMEKQRYSFNKLDTTNMTVEDIIVWWNKGISKILEDRNIVIDELVI